MVLLANSKDLRMFNSVCGKLVENNSLNATRRKQLVEIKRRKTGRKLTRRVIIR